jgi:hypothetical protein
MSISPPISNSYLSLYSYYPELDPFIIFIIKNIPLHYLLTGISYSTLLAAALVDDIHSE